MMEHNNISWFDLSTERLGYTNILGAARAGEVVVNGFYASTFSSLSWMCYVLALIGALVSGWALFKIVKRWGSNFGSFAKVATVLSLVLFAYCAFFIILLWDEPFGGIPAKLREGTFGDSFGTLNALFSGLAFSGVLITMLLQRKDLLEARAQVSNQQIESQFYNMLALQQNIVAGFDFKEKGVLLSSGRDCFKSWYTFFDSECRGLKPGGSRTVDDVYELMWFTYQGYLSLYFRSLYSVFKFVSECGHPESSKFGGVVRSFLSDFELVILYYNCLSPQGHGFKKYIQEFKVFDNLDVDMLVDVRRLAELHVQSYGDNQTALNVYAVLCGK
ncbi:putative phage abortive infection protein [Pseudomonas sp. F1002]|uniref:putative phage abortive infection protein n=1 Tax=Pseudomonas sp. F1002 TaxID=2738821 RepID=UPI0015A0B706|nr:putative phage abortive infection protein [Pseudomonas sp. F1002]NWB63814.1 putative phage abortive infection protein [Pseudomonas sp. F1002]